MGDVPWRYSPAGYSFVQRDAHGQILDAIDQILKLELFQDTYEKTMREGFRFSKQIEIAENAAELRVIARDEGTGAIGSVSIRLGKFFPAKTP